MSLNSDALITLASLKRHLDLPPNQDDYDTILETIINAMSATFARKLLEPVVYTSYSSEKVNGSGRTILRLPQRPVVTLTTVVEDDVTLTEDTDFYCHYDAGYLEKEDGATWNKGIKNIELTFTAGYYLTTQATTEDPIPSDFQLAMLSQCAKEWQTQKHKTWGEESRSLSEESVSLMPNTLLPEFLETIKRYRRPIP